MSIYGKSDNLRYGIDSNMYIRLSTLKEKTSISKKLVYMNHPDV